MLSLGVIHEVHTPISVLVLLMDKFNRNPREQSTEAVLGSYFEQIQKLKEVSVYTRRYLDYILNRSDQKKSFQTIENMRDFLEELLFELSVDASEIDLEELDVIHFFKTDTFWLRFCLLNLIKNARQHGSSKISITIGKTSNGCCFKFQNKSGEGGSKKGLGIALSIIKNRAKFLGGTLKIQSGMDFVTELKIRNFT
jgi:signal transduction histidine kinase